MNRKKALLAAVSLLISFTAAEVAARLVLPPPMQISTRRFWDPGGPKHVADPELGWIIEPGNTRYRFRAASQTGSVDVGYSIEQGRRITSGRPATGPLLIAAGCSFTFGFGIEDQDTWPWLLQERMSGYRVVNLGTNGYGTDQALLAAERAASNPADPARVIVLGFGDFQVERNRSTQAMVYYPWPLAKPMFRVRGDAVESVGLVRFWYPGTLLDHSQFIMHVANKLANVVNGVPDHAGARELTARLIVEFARRFEARGARLVVVILPHRGDQSRQGKDDNTFIVERLRAAGVPTLIPDYPRLPDGQLDRQRFLIPSDQLHPNRAYNVLLADQLARFLN
jgi:hypothetical protein